MVSRNGSSIAMLYVLSAREIRSGISLALAIAYVLRFGCGSIALGALKLVLWNISTNTTGEI